MNEGKKFDDIWTHFEISVSSVKYVVLKVCLCVKKFKCLDENDLSELMPDLYTLYESIDLFPQLSSARLFSKAELRKLLMIVGIDCLQKMLKESYFK